MNYFVKDVISVRLSAEELEFLNENYENIVPDGIKVSNKDFIIEAVKKAVSRVQASRVDSPETLAKLEQAQKDRDRLLTAINEMEANQGSQTQMTEALAQRNAEILAQNEELQTKLAAMQAQAEANQLAPGAVVIEFPEFLFPVLQKEAASQTQRRGKDIQPAHVLFELWLHNVTGTKDYLIHNYSSAQLKAMQKGAGQ